MSLQNSRSYPTNKILNVKLNLKNNLNKLIELQNISFVPKSEHITLDSPIQSLINLENESNGSLGLISHFQPECEYTFNVTSICDDNFTGSLGEVQIAWNDETIKKYKDYNIYNYASIHLLEVDIKHYDISLAYKSPGCFKGKIAQEYHVYVTNKSSNFKKLIFLIETGSAGSNFIISGNINKKFIIYPNETKTFVLNLIPLYYGKLKLPSFKFMEYVFNTEKWDNKKMSVYTFPDEYVLVSGEENLL